MAGPMGKIMHAELKIGDSMLMLSDEFPEMGSRSPHTLGGTASTVMLYVKDVDATFKRAVEAGARSVMEPADQFWGDRYARLTDPFGHDWGIGTHIEDVSQKETARRAEEWMAQQKAQG
jgi:PhnB protein